MLKILVDAIIIFFLLSYSFASCVVEACSAGDKQKAPVITEIEPSVEDNTEFTDAPARIGRSLGDTRPLIK